MKLLKPFLVAIGAAFAIGGAVAQDAPAPIKLSPKDAQNFLASAPGDLLIVGNDYRYDIVLPTDLLFDFDKSELRPEATPLLEKARAYLGTHKTDQVHVIGHTDAKGSEQHNFVLSQKRAGAVCDWLKRRVEAYVMCIGRGEEEPLLPDENADGSDNPVHRQLNRRVTLSVVRYPDADKMLGNAKSEADAALKRLRRPAEPAQ